MILKYFELDKINFQKTNFLLFHGKNEGHKHEEITKIIKKLRIKITNYDERQILENTEDFFEKSLNKSFFDEKEIIVINRCSDKIIKIVENLVEKCVTDTTFIFNSEILDKKSKLRNFFEKSKNQLVSVAFYPDTNEILSKLAQKIFIENKISLSNEYINFIVDKCAGDRRNLLNEIEKIQLYLKDKKNITNDEIFKLINLSENHSINDLINNCLAKKQKKIFNILNENIFSNEDCIIIIRTLLKKAKILLNLINQFNLNNDIEKTIKNARPPIFWKEKNIVKDQINLWSVEKIKNLIVETNNIELQIKKNSLNAINFTTNFLLEKSH
tara:strand:- start:419 stop:1402 length:984 start_codon:yes stop_codon:yes gene_type:complete